MMTWQGSLRKFPPKESYKLLKQLKISVHKNLKDKNLIKRGSVERIKNISCVSIFERSVHKS